MKRILFVIACLLLSLPGFAQFKAASYAVNGFTLPYQVLFPEGYKENKTYPLVVFLHGGGERGDDNQKQLANGKQFLLDNFQSKNPAIVIVPQCPAGNYWANVVRHQIDGKLTFRLGVSSQPTSVMETLILLIEDWMSSGKVDIDRVYAGGLSMGGFGTLELLWRMPQTFAAAFPICGGTDLNRLPTYAKHTAVWLFHGREDSVVPVQFSRDIEARLKELGGEVKYTEYKGVDHNSWDNAFQEKGLASWLFKHKR